MSPLPPQAKLLVNLIGGGFQHAPSSTGAKTSRHIEYVRNKIESGVSLYVDDGILQGLRGTGEAVKLAWLSESRALFPNQVFKERHKDILPHFTCVFTHDKELLRLDEKFLFLHANGFWVKEPRMCEKKRLVSMITSSKSFLAGHVFRLDWARRLQGKLDLFGRGFREIQDKEEALNDYMFSVAVENASYCSYFTEKILDCFATGTIPVYHGAPDIAEYFNKDGIITLTDGFDVSSLTPRLYESKLEAVRDNFERVLKYEVAEDYMYERYLTRPAGK